MQEEEDRDRKDGITDKEIYKGNPDISYLQKLFRPIKWIYKSMMVDSDYSEPEKIPIREDFREFVKVYITPDNSTSINSLTKSTITLLYYIFDALEIDSDYIYLHKDVVLEKTGLVSDTYYKAKKDLIVNEWIYRSPFPNKYYINLKRFAKGSVERIIEKKDIEEAINKIRESRRQYKEDTPARQERIQEKIKGKV